MLITNVKHVRTYSRPAGHVQRSGGVHRTIY